jgi:hypothetical protein
MDRSAPRNRHGRRNVRLALPGLIFLLSTWAPPLSALGFTGPLVIPAVLLSRLVVPGTPPASVAPQNAPGTAKGDSKWSDKIVLSGLVAGDGRWRSTGTGPTAAKTTDLYLRTLEIGIEAGFADWVSATVVLNSEYIGDPLNGADSGAVVDEAHIDIAVPHTPVYFIVGKRTQFFGLFDNHFVTDPLVQDAYETKVVGLTAGVKAPLSSDLSWTFYKGRVQSDHLAQSGLFDPDPGTVPQAGVDRVDSWILSGSASPAGEKWTAFAALASEPGIGRRMTALNLGTNLAVPGIKHVQIDAEVMRGLRREDVPGLGRPFRESALSFTASYQIVSRPRTEIGGRSYLARKIHRLAHPVEAGVRFEAFDDGGRAAALGSWSVRNRVSLGGRYTFFERENTQAAMSLEYRRQTLRISPLYAGAAGSGHEVYVRVGLDF